MTPINTYFSCDNFDIVVEIFNQMTPKEQIQTRAICTLFEEVVTFNSELSYNAMVRQISQISPASVSSKEPIEASTLTPQEQKILSYLVQEGRVDFIRFEELIKNTTDQNKRMWIQCILSHLAFEIYKNETKMKIAMISSSHQLSHEVFSALFEALSIQSHIISVGFSMCVQGAKTSADLPILQELLPKCKHIQRLLFSNAVHRQPDWAAGSGIAPLEKALSTMPSLCHLRFYDVELTDNDASILAHIIRHRKKLPVPLEELSVTGKGKLTNIGVEEILTAVVENPTKMTVELTNQNTTIELQNIIKQKLSCCSKLIKFTNN